MAGSAEIDPRLRRGLRKTISSHALTDWIRDLRKSFDYAVLGISRPGKPKEKSKPLSRVEQGEFKTHHAKKMVQVLRYAAITRQLKELDQEAVLEAQRRMGRIFADLKTREEALRRMITLYTDPKAAFRTADNRNPNLPRDKRLAVQRFAQAGLRFELREAGDDGVERNLSKSLVRKAKRIVAKRT